VRRAALVLAVLASSLGMYAAEDNIPEDAVVATINGKTVTAGEVLRMVEANPFPQAKSLFQKAPQDFLKALGVLRIFSDIAIQEGLDKMSPYKEVLEFHRQQILTQAALDNQRVSVTPSAEDQQAYYKAHTADFREARVRMIYFPFSDALSEGTAKEKAAKVVGQARLGSDFVKLAKENSADPTGAGADFVVKPSSSQPPPQMKAVLLQSKAGAITDPLRHDNGYYVFRVESMEVLPYEKVKDEIFNKIQDEHFRAWQIRTQQQVSVQIKNEAFFKSAGKQ